MRAWRPLLFTFALFWASPSLAQDEQSDGLERQPPPAGGTRLDLKAELGPPKKSDAIERGFELFGLSATGTRVDSSSDDATRIATAPGGSDVNALLGVRSLYYRTHAEGWTSRTRGGWRLGGGSAGLEGELAAQLSAGYRLPLAEHHGPFVRVGGSAELLGNDRFYWSRISLPEAHGGYQWLADDSHLELHALSGWYLAGHFHLVRQAFRDITRARSLGARLALGIGSMHAEVTYLRLTHGSHAPKAPISTLDALACVVFGAPVLCAEVRYFDGVLAERRGNGRFDAQVGYAGVTFGFGPQKPLLTPPLD